MEKKSSILTLALAAAFTVLPGAAKAQDPEIRVVSSAAMDALEAWSTAGASYETLALDRRPELIDEYAPVAEAYHGGRPLAEIFAERLPQTYAEIQRALGGDPKGDGGLGGSSPTPAGGTEVDREELLAYAMSSGSDEYVRWQTELQVRGAGFQGYIDRYHPEVVAEVGQLNVTPADKGISLLDFAHASGDATLFEEIRRLLDTVAKKKDCTCWTVVNFPEQPAGWTLEINDNYSNSWGWPVKKRQNLSYNVTARGAARDINFWKKSEHNLWEQARDKSSNLSSMRVRMSCTKNNSTGQSCTGPTCKGEFVTRIGYASRVYERHDVGGPWSREAQALTADHAKATYDGPGAGPVVTLFNKGVAVSGQYQSGWNASAIANILYVAGQVVLAVATDGTSAATLLSQDMVNTTVNSIAGLITHSGSPGSRQRDMMVAYDNSVGAPIVLNPNETHLFEVKSSSKIYSRGYGGKSETWGNIDSSDYLVGVGRNYHCASNVFPPVARAHWIYGGTSNSPYSTPTMQNFVGTFTQTELGVYPPNLSTIPGQFP